MGVDVIVVNYRTPTHLRAFLDSLKEHSPSVPWSLTVVNVDPRPEDVSAGLSLTPWTVPFNHIETLENVGYARAVNTASRHTNQDVLAIFNADTTLTAYALDDCYAALTAANHKDWGILGPRQVDRRSRITHAGIVFRHGYQIERGWREPDGPEFRDVREVESVMGSAYFIKRETWNALTNCEIYQSFCIAEGAFLPTQHYYEETFCSIHARHHGWKVIYYGPVLIGHEWHTSSPVGGQIDRKIRPESKKLFVAACDAHGIDPGIRR